MKEEESLHGKLPSIPFYASILPKKQKIESWKKDEFLVEKILDYWK